MCSLDVKVVQVNFRSDVAVSACYRILLPPSGQRKNECSFKPAVADCFCHMGAAETSGDHNSDILSLVTLRNYLIYIISVSAVMFDALFSCSTCSGLSWSKQHRPSCVSNAGDTLVEPILLSALSAVTKYQPIADSHLSTLFDL